MERHRYGDVARNRRLGEGLRSVRRVVAEVSEVQRARHRREVGRALQISAVTYRCRDHLPFSRSSFTGMAADWTAATGRVADAANEISRRLRSARLYRRWHPTAPLPLFADRRHWRRQDRDWAGPCPRRWLQGLQSHVRPP